MAKGRSSFYVIWFLDDTMSNGKDFLIVSKTELYTYLRSGKAFSQIKPFYHCCPGEIFKQLTTSYRMENDNG